MTDSAGQVPVTVITGFLGAGKTTFLNQILSGDHGKKYAVIVNEFGEIGIDGALIVAADEEIYEMNNGCVCCTVRGDLIRVLGGLLRRANRFDGILLETTGLADPAPVAQTFFTDHDIAAQSRLDSVVALVDAVFLKEQVKKQPEVEQQIAFADVIVLNKTDLADAQTLADVETIIRTLNPTAPLYKTSRGQIEVSQILGHGGFDLNRVMETLPSFLEEEKEHSHEHGPDCGCGCHGHHHHHHHHDEPAQGEDCACGCCLSVQSDDVATKFRHDTAISSLSLVTDQALDPLKIQNWLSALTAEKGQDLLRFKGIFNLAGEDRRLVIQGVHMMMEGSTLSPWPLGKPRFSRLVLIGRNLPEKELRQGFLACIAPA